MLKNTIVLTVQYGEDSGRDWANSKERPDVQPLARQSWLPGAIARILVYGKKLKIIQETNEKNKNNQPDVDEH